MKKEYTCIVCPNGCLVTAERDTDHEEYTITGHGCARGVDYVRQELTDPRRTVSTTVGVKGGDMPLASIRVTSPIPLGKIPEAMRLIHAKTLTAPVHAGDIVIHSLLGLDCDVIAACSVSKRRI